MGQEATVITLYGTTDWFKIGKAVRQDHILSLCLFTLNAEYIMQKARLDELQLESRPPGKISTTSDMQMTPPWLAESEEKLRILLVNVKEKSEKKTSLKLNIQKTEIMASAVITSWQIEWENVEAVTDFLFLGS